MHRAVCPTCKAPVETCDLGASRDFPFCSRRCKLIDLGQWFDEAYRISEPAESGDEEE